MRELEDFVGKLYVTFVYVYFSVYSADDDTEIIGYLIVSIEVSEFLRNLVQQS
jgi:hypothetical protein